MHVRSRRCVASSNDYDSSRCQDPVDSFCLANTCVPKLSGGSACDNDNACVAKCASDFEDLRRALTKWAEFEFQHFEAIMEHNTAVAKLSRAVGVPLTEP